MSSFTRVIVLSALLFFVGVHSHSYLSSLYVEGQALSEGECLRPIPATHYDYPIANLDNPNGINSDAMICGALPEGKQAAKKKCAVNPGANLGVQWHYEKGAGASDTFIIDPSHKGPCLVYLAKSDTGAGAVWFKIFEDGYNINTKQWCVDKLRANKGRFDFQLPTDIAPGNYLMRVELIALHEGEQLGGAQPYVHCAEITVGGNGKGVPSSDIMVAFPGAYKADSPGILFNIYSGNKYLNINGYPIPGPKLYVSGQGSTPVPSTTGKPATTGTTTGKPATTTGKPVTTATTTGKPATTGTTTGKPSTTTGKPATTGTTANSSCVAGADFTACVGTTATQRCYNGVLYPAINCQTGLVCKYSPSSVDKLGNQNGYCMRPTDIPRDNAEANGSSQLVNSLWVSMILFVVCYLL